MLDLALCMTVNPGWGGQAFIAHSLEKLRARAARSLGERAGASRWTAGIDPETAPRCRAAGASLFVAGSAIFGAAGPRRGLRRDRAARSAPS